MHPFFDLLARFKKDERGVFGVIFAVLAIVLVAAAGAVVDFTYMETARSRAQTALDAAALALQAKLEVTGEDFKTDAQNILVERLGDPNIVATVTSATPNVTTGTLNLQARMVVPTSFIQLIGIRTITTNLQSEATRGSSNLEVSVALDVTGSMGVDSWGRTDLTKINGLIGATNNLINLVVKDQQPPTSSSFTRMALVPYSAAVNVGSTTLANKVRGTPVATTVNISGAKWKASPAVSTTVTAVSKASTAKITGASLTGINNDDYVYITGINGSDSNKSTGMETINNRAFQVTGKSSNTFSLTGIKSSNFNDNWKNGGTITKCAIANCDVVITTSSNHGYTDGQAVYVSGVGGLTSLNNNGYYVDSLTSTTLTLLGSMAGGGGTYTSGGTIQCANYGCQYLHFTSKAGSENTFGASTCTSERGAEPDIYTDVAPSTTPLNYTYSVGSGNPCPSVVIQPLTSDKDTLHNLVGTLSPAGSTAGQIGLAWAWYLVSPNFAYLFPKDETHRLYPASPYKDPKLVKAVILMTDGAFNTAYCDGVISGDSTSGSGGDGDHISRDSTHASTDCNAVAASRAQAASLCTAIKADTTGITLYTVGFDISGTSADDLSAQSFLKDCASADKYFYLAVNASDLNDAFTSIAGNLADLRLSK